VLRQRTIQPPLFQTHILQVLLSTHDELETYLKNNNIVLEGQTDDCGGLHANVCNNVHIIWVDSKLDKTSIISAIVHEVMHYTFSALADVGLSLTDSSEETYTYFTQNIFAQIVKEFKLL